MNHFLGLIMVSKGIWLYYYYFLLVFEEENFSTYNRKKNFFMISRRLNNFQVLKWDLKFICQYLSLELFKRFSVML